MKLVELESKNSKITEVDDIKDEENRIKFIRNLFKHDVISEGQFKSYLKRRKAKEKHKKLMNDE